jgi:hypothetical protein
MAEEVVQFWNAQSRAEARRFYELADKQHELVNEAYRNYHKAAMVVAKLYREDDNTVPKRNEPGYKEWAAATEAKARAYAAWQKQAQIHGAMFVPLMDRPVNVEVDQKEPW